MNAYLKWLNRRSPGKDKQGQHFSELDKIWQAAGQNDLPEADIDKAWRMVDSQIKDTADNIKRVFFFQKQPAISALALTILVLGVLSSVYFFLQPQIFIYQTQPAQTMHIVLPDSSEVILNASSRITFDENFDIGHRHLSLKGEALFHVQKGRWPFNIATGNTSIRVVGTTFNVQSRDDNVRVGVKEGVVEFSKISASADSVVRLRKGEQSWCTRSSLPVAAAKLDTEIFPDWFYQKLSCKQTPFDEVCRELERRFNTSIIIKDEQIKSVHISGLFEAQDLDALLKTICVLVDKEYRYEKNTVIIY